MQNSFMSDLRLYKSMKIYAVKKSHHNKERKFVVI